MRALAYGLAGLLGAAFGIFTVWEAIETRDAERAVRAAEEEERELELQTAYRMGEAHGRGVTGAREVETPEPDAAEDVRRG